MHREAFKPTYITYHNVNKKVFWEPAMLGEFGLVYNTTAAISFENSWENDFSGKNWS